MNRRTMLEVILLLVSSAMIALNSMMLNSALIGFAASLGFFYVVSMTLGRLFYSDERTFFKVILGLATLLSIMTLLGTFLMLLSVFTEVLSICSVLSVGVILYVVSARKKFHDQTISGQPNRKKSIDVNSYVSVVFYLISVGLAFFALLCARTGEGGSSVWLTIPSFFLPVFLFSSVLLAVILFLTPIDNRLKLVLLLVHSFLSHSLFLLVWYPGRYGDPWKHMGESRFIDNTGMPYAYSWLLKARLVVDIVRYKAHYALVVFFARMFSLDIYWVHVFFIPLLWSFFVPIFSYKIAELLASKRTTVFPLITAASTGLFATLILWGAISTPNSLSFIFFFFDVMLLLSWIKTSQKEFWFLSLLASIATFFAHPSVGIFALFFTAWVTILQKGRYRIFKIVSFPLIWVLYPLALYSQGATFSFEGLFAVENFISFWPEVIVLPFIFVFVGLLFSIKSRRVNGKSASMLLLFYVAVIISYYITKYGMKNTPFGPHRILAMSDLLSVPFVALGLLVVADSFKKCFSHRSIKVNALKKTFLHLVSVMIICLILSSQLIFALHQAYPQEEIQKVQPSVYEMEAIQYIDENWAKTGRFVVLADMDFVFLAIGLMGAQYKYGTDPRGLFGYPSWSFWTVQKWGEMSENPSIQIMEDARFIASANVTYFVLNSERKYNFDVVFERTRSVLPWYETFPRGEPEEEAKIYLFRYPYPPPPVFEGDGPTVKVIYDEEPSMENVSTKFKYIYQSQVKYTLSLSGYTSYNITDYPKHWMFLNLTVDGSQTEFHQSSDINSFIYLEGLEPSKLVEVTWQANDLYAEAIWKDDSFKTGWITHPLYTGKDITPNVVKDGNILNISGAFLPDQYQYYYYVKQCKIKVTNDGQYILVRWKSTGSVAAVFFSYTDDEATGLPLIQYSSYSEEWTVVISEELEPGKEISFVGVGISNYYSRGISGFHSMYVDFILIASETPAL